MSWFDEQGVDGYAPYDAGGISGGMTPAQQAQLQAQAGGFATANQGYNEQQGPRTTPYEAPSGWEQARLNDTSDKSGKYVMQRWMQDNGYGAGGDKAYNADAVRAFVASQNGQWEMQGSPDDPQIRQTQAYLSSFDPGRETRWQDVIKNSGPGGTNEMSFANAETRPGEGGFDAGELARPSGGPTAFSGGGNYTASGGGQAPRNVLSQATFDPYKYQEFVAPDAFKAPGAEGMAEDPGYQFRLKSTLGAMQNSAAAKGLLRSTGTFQGLMDKGGEMASQEYGNVYGRRASEYDRSYSNAFGANQAGNQGRLSGFQANVNAALGQGNLDLGYTQAGNSFALGQGNLALGNRQADQSYALGNLQAQNSYALGQGNLGLGWANQNLAAQGQNFNQGYSLSNMGLQAAGLQGGYGNQYAQNAGGYATGAGNANAAGVVGGANAWNAGMTNAFNNAAQLYGNYYDRPS